MRACVASLGIWTAEGEGEGEDVSGEGALNGWTWRAAAAAATAAAAKSIASSATYKLVRYGEGDRKGRINLQF